MLGSDVRVAETPRLFLRENENLACRIGEAVKTNSMPPFSLLDAVSAYWGLGD